MSIYSNNFISSFSLVRIQFYLTWASGKWVSVKSENIAEQISVRISLPTLIFFLRMTNIFFLNNTFWNWYTSIFFIIRMSIMVLNATFNNISVLSRQSVLLVEEIRVPGENHRPAASHCEKCYIKYTSSEQDLNSLSQLYW